LAYKCLLFIARGRSVVTNTFEMAFKLTHVLILVLKYFFKYFLVFRPPDISVGGLTFYRNFFLLSSSCSFIPSTELNQNRPNAWKSVRFQNACLKSGLSPPLKIGSPKTTFFDDFAT